MTTINHKSAEKPTAIKTTPGESHDVSELLAKVEQLLNEGKPAAALERIGKSKLRSAWVMNAAAVCQLRLGNPQLAVQALRGLVLGAGGIIMRADAPVVFKLNFALALIADGNLSGGSTTLHELRGEIDPAVQEVQAAMLSWKSSLSLWQRFWWLMGSEPKRPPKFDIPLGFLR